MVDLDHVAVTAAPARDRHDAGGGDPHRFADDAAEVEAGVHRRPLRNGSMRMPKPDDRSISPETGLRIGTATSSWVSWSAWRART